MASSRPKLFPGIRAKMRAASALLRNTPRSPHNLYGVSGPVRYYSASSTSSDGQMRMLIVGSPGSGKGTQSAKLLSRYDFSVISAGDVLRSHIQRKTEIGQRAATVIQQGNLMPDEIMMSLIGSEVAALSTSWLLDGFPRTLGQAQLLDKQLDEVQRKPLHLVVNLDVPEDVILERILQRWTHPSSGRIYNLSFNPPKVPGKDDVTGEPLVQRDDDNAVSTLCSDPCSHALVNLYVDDRQETFAKRLKSFHAQTQPMLEHYRQKSQLLTNDVLEVDCRSAPAPSSANSPASSNQALYVNLRGNTSAQIWPHLLDIIQRRFPYLPAAKSQASPTS